MPEPGLTPAVGERITLEVTSVATGGEAFGRFGPPPGLAVFADSGLPGDTIVGRVSQSKGRFVRVVTESVVAPSPLRVASGCAVADACGGCRFWGATAEDELRWKSDAVVESVRRIAGGVVWPDAHIEGSPLAEGYRDRARLRVDGTGAVGFLGARSASVVPVDRCLVLHPALDAARPRASALFAGLPGLDSVFLEWDDERAGVAVSGAFADRDIPAVLRSVRERVERLRPLTDITTVVVAARERHHPVVGDGLVWRRRSMGDASVVVRERAMGFSQANGAMNPTLQAAVLRGLAAATTTPGTALELYSGAGNLTFPLLGAGWSVDALDVAAPGVHAAAGAWRGVVARPPVRARFEVADLRLGLPPRISERLSSYHALVLDPPRGGVDGALMRALEPFAGDAIVYVSCDPPAMARDVAAFGARGFRVERWEVLDMFPRTPHVEVVATLCR